MQNKIISMLKIGIIIALNLCIIALVVYTYNLPAFETEAVEVLSRLGSRGDEVKKIQTKLKQWGYYSGSVDGIYGNQTERAVRWFQQKNGLTADGIAGPQTLKAIGLPTGGSGGGSSGGSSGGGGSTSVNSNDQALLARIISAEARGEPYNGQVAVGACVLNRVKHPSFPNTLAGVVYQPGAFTAITDGQIKEAVTESARKAAQDALNGWDPSGGAIYYFNPDKTSNKWIRTRPVIKRIGSHLFCS